MSTRSSRKVVIKRALSLDNNHKAIITDQSNLTILSFLNFFKIVALQKIQITWKMKISVRVDLMDQYLSYYSFEHRGIKWYFRIVMYLVEVAIINSYNI